MERFDVSGVDLFGQETIIHIPEFTHVSLICGFFENFIKSRSAPWSSNQTISHLSPFITSSEHLFLLPFKDASRCLLWQVCDLHSLGSIHLFGRSTVGMVESRDSQVDWIRLSFHVWFSGNIWTGWAQIIRHLPSDNPHISRLTQLYHMSTTFRPFNH